jgi:hypothetical protein
MPTARDSGNEREESREFSLEDIPKRHLAAVRRYITVNSGIVDSALRRQDLAQLEELDAFIYVVTLGLFQLPSFRGVVYRGTTLSDDGAALYFPGAVLFEPAFVSATANPACRFPGNTTFVIASINGRDVSMLADSPEEAEVLFFAGSRFKVLATEYDSRADDRRIFLAEIPDPGLLAGHAG